MRLSEYMQARGLDDQGMAALIGECSESAVKKWRYGERIPRAAAMARIRQVTDGAVTANDFLSDNIANGSEAA